MLATMLRDHLAGDHKGHNGVECSVDVTGTPGSGEKHSVSGFKDAVILREWIHVLKHIGLDGLSTLMNKLPYP